MNGHVTVTYQSTKIIKGFYVCRLVKIVLVIRELIQPAVLFLRKFNLMEVSKSKKGLYWILFFISCLALVVAIAAHWPWLTLIIPFVTTFFVLAMDII